MMISLPATVTDGVLPFASALTYALGADLRGGVRGAHTLKRLGKLSPTCHMNSVDTLEFDKLK
jgi:hypothetical protein